jgi:WD40 repeat protein
MIAPLLAAALLGQTKLDYAKDVFPVLQKYCVGCHNADDMQGGLDMSDFAAFKSGGKKGAAFVAGKSGESRMILMRDGRVKPKMPPKDNPAPKDAEWKTLADWIDQGAHGPNAGPSAAASEGFKVAKKHSKPAAVGAVAFSADGKLLALARGREVSLINPTDGGIVRSLESHSGRVAAIRFSRNGGFLATASGVPGKFGEIRLFDPSTGKLLRKLSGHKDAIYGLDVSSDDKLIASAGYDRDILIWDASTGERKQLLKGHNDAVYALAFSPDGSKLASTSGDRTFKIWSVAKGERLDTFSQPLQDQFAVAFSADGTRLFGAGADNRVRIWSISKTGVEGTNTLLDSKFAHEGPILQLTVSLDGKTFATGSQDGGVKIWRTDTVAETAVLDKQSDWPAALALSPDGSLLAVGRNDGSASLYSTATKKVVRSLDPAPPPKPKVVALASVMPAGVELGATTMVTLVGDGLHGESVSIKANHPAVTTTVTAKTKIGDKESLSLSIAVKPDAKKGEVELTAVNAAGSSKPVKLFIDDIPQIAEKESPAVQNVGNPVAAWGVISMAGDMDAFTIEAKADEALVFDLSSKPIGSKLDGHLEVFDANGLPLESSTSFDGDADPMILVTPKKAGIYRVVVRDAKLGGSADHRYKLSMGRLPVVTGVFPLGVAKGKTAEVSLVGANLGGPKTPIKVTVDSSNVGDVGVSLPSDVYRIRKPLRVAVGELPEVVEAEPNDNPKSATKMPAPGIADGRFLSSSGEDLDHFRFASKKGERWIVETESARRGSPADTKIEVLDANGRPIPKVRLRATRDANIHFRNIDSNQLEIRTTNWTEMELNQYLYMAGEVGKYFRLPQGPDSGFLFYDRKGTRLTYFDTSPTAHALGDPIYIVEPMKEGETASPTGLPTFTLNHENDDAGDRTIGRDSRLTFTAPADGEYLLRVADSRAKTGDRFAYRAIVRRPNPDFTVSLTPRDVSVGAGSGREVDVFLDRVDGFDDEVTLTIESLPKGFHTASPVTVQAGHNTAALVVFADGDAVPPKDMKPIKVTASATINGKKIVKPAGEISKIMLTPRPKLIVRLSPAELTIRPGETITAELSIERHGYKDRVTFTFPNLPHGVFVDNIGLSGILIRPNETKRQVVLTARPWVPETTRPFFAQSNEEGKQCSPPLTLHVRKATAVASGR